MALGYLVEDGGGGSTPSVQTHDLTDPLDVTWIGSHSNVSGNGISQVKGNFVIGAQGFQNSATGQYESATVNNNGFTHLKIVGTKNGYSSENASNWSRIDIIRNSTVLSTLYNTGKVSDPINLDIDVSAYNFPFSIRISWSNYGNWKDYFVFTKMELS